MLKTQVIYMLILIMVLFFLCWAPILTFNLLAAFELLGPDNMGAGVNTKNIKTAFSLLSYSNRSFVNHDSLKQNLISLFQLLESNNLRVYVKKFPSKLCIQYLFEKKWEEV